MASRRRGAVARTMLTLALGAGLLAACDTVSGAVDPAVKHVPDAVVQDRAACPLPENGSGVPTPAMPRPGRVPDGFVPVAAVECPVMPTVTDDEGVWSAVEQVRYTGDLTALLATLAEPDDRAPANLACAAMLVIAPPLWLVDAEGRAVLVHRPADECGNPKGDVDARLRDLTVESRKTTKVRLITPRAAIEADCETGWKLEPPSSHASTTAPEEPSTAAGTLRVCRYDVDPAEEITTGGGDVSVGMFASGGEIRSDHASRTRHLAASGTLAPPCTTDPTRFAVVLPTAGHTGEAVWVELDGCRRTWTEESTPRTAPAELLDLVAG